MNPYEKINEVKQAVVSLGYKDTVKVVAVELDEDRAQVILPDDGGEIGIYGFSKHTFVD